MITEDYVSFETAKLLKEKGFNEKCGPYYILNGTLINGVIIEGKHNVHENNFSAPTIQMAMKWLRRNYYLHIDVDWTYNSDPTITDDFSISYFFSITSWKYPNEFFSDNYNIFFETYEKACEEAIKYCLENLI